MESHFKGDSLRLSSLKFWRSRRGLFSAAALILVGLFFVRPGVQKMRNRIASEISVALGRQVEISSVSFHLLPRPGFDLENFVVHDNPVFGAEPMLRASEVTASLRLIPLLFGRLEISRLVLTSPSLNLVRNPQGRWNIEDLIERNALIPAAPTSKRKTERRPGFPYIEVGQGRINFKTGLEKTPYSLTEADFAVFQDSENSWGMRLKAIPLRTDRNVTDTGVITMDGSWKRASSLHLTPLAFKLQWDRAQLGQFTKLFRGNDSGWRGTVRLNTTLTGTPNDLEIASSLAVQDFRRFDVLTDSGSRLGAVCTGNYSSADHSVSVLNCQSTVGDGLIALTGKVSDVLATRIYDFDVTAHDVPMQALANLAIHTRKSIPQDLRADGTLDAHFTLQPAAWHGGGTTNQFRLTSLSTGADYDLGRVPFTFDPPSLAAPKKSTRTPAPSNLVSENRLKIGPFDVALGNPTSLSVEGWVSSTGFGFQVRGDAQPQQLAEAAQTVGFPPPQPPSPEARDRNLQIAGNWTDPETLAGLKN